MKAQLLFERKLKVVRKEPFGHRTTTEVHVYSDRGTCVPRPRYMRTPTEVHVYPDRDAMTFLKQPGQTHQNYSDKNCNILNCKTLIINVLDLLILDIFRIFIV